ncbi:MAG: sulfotransferase, partial [Rudaea sp.]
DLQRAFVRYLPHSIKQANARWGIKICTYHWPREDYDRFFAAFPRAQVVFVLRDGRDVLLSMLKRSKIVRTPEQTAMRWLETVQVYDYLCDKLPRQLHSYHYEDLVSNPAAQMVTICSFLGLRFRPELLDPQTWPRHGSYAIAPVTAEKAGKWRVEGLPPLPADVSSQFAAAVQRLGYGD